MDKKKISVIKVINTILGIAVIVCIVVNVRQFNNNNTFKNETDVVEKDIETTQTDRDTSDTDLESEKESLSDLSTQTDALNEEVGTFETENQNLSDSLSELEE